MKKISLLMMAMAISALTFTACEDVPEPYPTPDPTNNGGNNEQNEGTATGDGTLANPFNSVAAAKAAKELGSGNVSEQMYYIKGKVVSIATDKNGNVLNFDQGTYGNASFYISDDGKEDGQFYCYRVLYLGNKKWTNGAGDILKVGDEVIVCAKLTLFNTTPETQQNEGYLYKLNDKTEGNSEETGEATGDGTLENPFNAIAATNEAKKLASGASTDKAYYIKGKVVSIAKDKNGNVQNFDFQTYGNATFYISDDGKEANQFYCYQVLYLGNKKWTQGAGDILKVGDDVIVCAKLTMFNQTPETLKGEGYLYKLNDKTEASGGEETQPTGDIGSIDAPKTVAEALAVINALEDGAITDANYYVKGKVVSVATKAEDIGPNSSSGKKYSDINYYISEDGTDANTIYVYRGKNLNNTNFTSADQLKVNDEVIVYGKLQKFKNSNTNEIVPEMTQGNYLVKTDNTGEGSGNEGSGEQEGATVSSLENGDFETWANGIPTGWQSASSASSASLAQSNTAHGGNYAVIVKGGGTQNKRLASQEITLAAGTYTFTFWVKATSENKAQTCAGYVPVTNGSVGTYKYKTGADNKTAYETIGTTWSQVTYEFTLDAETTLCLIVMNPKSSSYSSGEDILVDDAKLTKK